jgi:microcystin-dependent protein
MAVQFNLSFNPVWSMVDLNGLQLDDTYYMFTLSNTVPYNNQAVYTTQDNTTPWPNPIQFLANGTLPVNIYWDDSLVYRIEIRQGNTQADPLIYLVENCVPSGGSSNTVASDNNSDNQVTNPQFYNVNFPAASNLVISTASTTTIAPGWQVITTGGGTLTISQLTFSGDENIAGNPSYGISIVNSGFSTVTLQQTFANNGALWAGEYVDFDITAQAVGSQPTLNAQLLSSGAQTTALLARAINSGWQSLGETAAVPASTDTTIPANAFTKLQIFWVGNTTVNLTNIQLLGQVAADNTITYQQITLERQIDHEYNVAYPIVPVGTIIDFFGFTTPLHYLICNYGTYNRIQYPQLFNTITATETVTLTSAVATFTVVDGTKYSIGFGVEGTGIPAATTIINISSNTITISSPASVTGSQSLRFFAAGNRFQETVTWASSTTFTVASGAAYAVGEAITGDGIPSATVITVIATNLITISNATAYVATNTSLVYFYDAANGNGTTTFNIPDLRRRGTVGSGGVVISASPLGVGNHFGNVGGEESHTQVLAELVQHSHTYNLWTNTGAGGFGAAAGTLITTPSTATGTTPSSAATPFNLYEPSLVTNKCIRYE